MHVAKWLSAVPVQNASAISVHTLYQIITIKTSRKITLFMLLTE
jgi:hypothetical protein